MHARRWRGRVMLASGRTSGQAWPERKEPPIVFMRQEESVVACRKARGSMTAVILIGHQSMPYRRIKTEATALRTCTVYPTWQGGKHIERGESCVIARDQAKLKRELSAR